MQQQYNNLNDLAIRKAELKAQLEAEAKTIKRLQKSLIAKPKSSKRLSFLHPGNLLTTSMTALDGAWFAWKLYKKLRK